MPLLLPWTLPPSFRAGLPRAVLTLGVAALLGACASPASIPPGTTEAEVVRQMGTPNVERDLPGGGKRLIYSGQPMGQFAWLTDIDASGRVVSTTQALTSERFNMINDGLAEGRWTRDRLLLEFGPPAEITRVAMQPDQAIWGYRFRQDGVWNSLMYVYVAPDGRVTRFHPGPDPRYERLHFMGM
jgi:hypothetical protein